MSLAALTSDALDPRLQLKDAYGQVLRSASTLSIMSGYMAQFPEENAEFTGTWNNLVSARGEWMRSYSALMDTEGRLGELDWAVKAKALAASGYELVNVIESASESVKRTDWGYLFKTVAYHATNIVTAIPRYTTVGLLSLGKEAVEVGIEGVGEVAQTLGTQTKLTLESLGLSPTRLIWIAAAVGGAYLFLPRMLAGKK